MVTRRFHTAKAQVRFQGGQYGILLAPEQSFFKAILVSPVSVILLVLRTHSFIYHRQHIILLIASFVQ
jgi:hypothetical protein